MTISDLCSTFYGDDVHIYIYHSIYPNLIPENRYNYSGYITHGNIIDYPDCPSYDKNYDNKEIIKWNMDYDIVNNEWVILIQI